MSGAGQESPLSSQPRLGTSVDAVMSPMPEPFASRVSCPGGCYQVPGWNCEWLPSSKTQVGLPGSGELSTSRAPRHWVDTHSL